MHVLIRSGMCFNHVVFASPVHLVLREKLFRRFSPARRCSGFAGHHEALRTEIVCDLLRTVAGEPLDDLRSVPAPIERMLDVVLRRLHLGPTAADLVHASDLGRSQAYALFTDFYGLSPRRALELRRLELAEALLAAGHGVSETAAACGWANRETFSRA